MYIPTFGVLPSSPSMFSFSTSIAFLFFSAELGLEGKTFPLVSPFFRTTTLNSSSSVSMILGTVVSGVVVGMKAVVLSLVAVFFHTAVVVVGAAVIFMGAQVGETGCWVGRLLGGKMRRYLGGDPGRLRRLELGQLWRAHRDLDRGFVERSQVFLGATAHVTMRERTPPPHVTGHCEERERKKKSTQKKLLVETNTTETDN